RVDPCLGYMSQNTFCTAFSIFKPNKKVLETLNQIANNQILPDHYDPKIISTEYTSPEGLKIKLPSILEFPEYFQSFIRNVNYELSDWAKRTISVLRWRTNNLGLHNPISTRGLFWSFDEVFWHPAPSALKVRIHMTHSPKVLKNQNEEIFEIVKSLEIAPLHHDLFREAWNQLNNNPRSALIIGISAAEISIKKCISNLVPNAKWLVFNLPSPPLIRILVEYLPTLPIKYEIKPPSSRILNILEKGVTIRNQLIHTGSINPSIDEVEEILIVIHDLLYLIDYYCGSKWALEFLCQETKEELSIIR
ncbi:hypothetical protein KJ742_01915, partial [Patescibacteria group bacterium]|nr:hypothetical protein [Patescibacteria group bacterium]